MRPRSLLRSPTRVLPTTFQLLLLLRRPQQQQVSPILILPLHLHHPPPIPSPPFSPCPKRRTRCASSSSTPRHSALKSPTPPSGRCSVPSTNFPTGTLAVPPSPTARPVRAGRRMPTATMRPPTQRSRRSKETTTQTTRRASPATATTAPGSSRPCAAWPTASPSPSAFATWRCWFWERDCRSASTLTGMWGVMVLGREGPAWGRGR
mmetsp:Transcript_27724/g.80016  ORF Transcript_27724/g.80016 Transcript_27724/m.80016 type:complete len:207 (-) Transcript_27724:2619-3239(-)